MAPKVPVPATEKPVEEGEKGVASFAPTRPNISAGTMLKEGAKNLMKGGDDEPEESALDRLKGMAKTAYNTVKAVRQ